MDKHDADNTGHETSRPHDMKMYLRFAAMIVTGMVLMYALMLVGSWEWGHVRWSQSRMFMALTMGGAMGLLMLAWMLNMFRNAKANVGIIAVSLLLLGGGAFLDRSQITVDDSGFMNAMIPHHSLAITRSERAQIADVRVCELAVQISEAQRREILEMEWLIEDIERNGPAETPEEAQARPVPDFSEAAERQCPAN
jgi:ABC-type multidrug transport system fused ATPase/permease subunit